VYKWPSIIDELTANDRKLSNIAELAFCRNDVVDDITKLLQLEGYGADIQADARRFSKRSFTVDLRKHEPSFEVGSPVSFPKDVAFYNGHMYLTGREGVFASTIAQNGTFGGLTPLTQIHDFPGVALRAKYGVVSISGGHSGVLCLPLAPYDSSLPSAGEPFLDESVTSRKCSWMVEDILNVQLDGGLGYIDNATEEQKTQYSIEREKRYISHLGTRVITNENIVRDFGEGPIEGAFASNKRLYAIDANRVMHIAEKTEGPGISDQIGFELRRNISFGSQVYDGYSMTKGLVVDGEEGTFYFRGNGHPAILHPGENVTVRSFNNSIYYKRIIASVKEDHSLVSCIWPDFAD
jgi:hypothetical protein